MDIHGDAYLQTVINEVRAMRRELSDLEDKLRIRQSVEAARRSLERKGLNPDLLPCNEWGQL